MKSAPILLATVVWLAACGARADGPPAIVVDRSACSHCGMLISVPVYAAALRIPDGGERVFDDIGCLIAAVRRSSLTGARFWFQDAAGSGWIDGDSAVFLASARLRTPMGGGVAAYRTVAEAAQAGGRLGGEVIASFGALRERRSR
jgi:nitrous oxide reductase accessory protein NosL